MAANIGILLDFLFLYHLSTIPRVFFKSSFVLRDLSMEVLGAHKFWETQSGMGKYFTKLCLQQSIFITLLADKIYFVDKPFDESTVRVKTSCSFSVYPSSSSSSLSATLPRGSGVFPNRQPEGNVGRYPCDGGL